MWGKNAVKISMFGNFGNVLGDHKIFSLTPTLKRMIGHSAMSITLSLTFSLSAESEAPQ